MLAQPLAAAGRTAAQQAHAIGETRGNLRRGKHARRGPPLARSPAANPRELSADQGRHARPRSAVRGQALDARGRHGRGTSRPASQPRDRRQMIVLGPRQAATSAGPAIRGSPSTPSGWRLAASTRNSGQPREQRDNERGLPGASIRCSQLSSTSSALRSFEPLDRGVQRRAPSRLRQAGSASRHQHGLVHRRRQAHQASPPPRARATNTSSSCSLAHCAVWSARPSCPAPPTPVSVNSRVAAGPGDLRQLALTPDQRRRRRGHRRVDVHAGWHR